jgi:hypothetical protein
MLLPAGAFKEVDIPIAIAQLASEVADYLASNFCGMRRDDLLDPYVTKAVQAAEANLALKRAGRKPMPMPACAASIISADALTRDFCYSERRGWSARVTCVPQDYALGQEGQVDWYEAWAELDGVQVPLQVMARRIPCTPPSI